MRIIASANISKILWPNETYKDRGVRLRKMLHISDNNILRDRTFRNHFEHYDERIAKWFEGGANGVFIDFANETHHVAAHLRSITDVSGAGDTVVSIAAMCLALKLSPKAIAEMSNLGGGLVCEYVGVVPIEKEKLKAEYQKHL